MGGSKNEKKLSIETNSNCIQYNGRTDGFYRLLISYLFEIFSPFINPTVKKHTINVCMQIT